MTNYSCVKQELDYSYFRTGTEITAISDTGRIYW